MSLEICLSFIVTFLISLVLVPFVGKITKKLGIIAHTNNRTIHKGIIVRTDGYAIYISFLIGAMIFLKTDIQINSILLGGFIIFLTGFYDDIHDLSPKLKMLGQIIAALIVIFYGGISLKGFSIPFLPSQFSYVIAIIITIGWIVGVTNAINLIDGLDGLSSGIALISCVSMLIIFALNGSPIIAILLITALAGALSGFLPFNFNPAKTFMGDAGSNFLGYCLSVISIFGVAKTYTLVVVVAPLIILGLPVIDTIVAIFRRIIKGKSIKAIMKADKNHFHHKLLKMGFSQREAVLVMYAITAALGLFAIVLLESGIWKAISFLLLVVAIIAIGYKNFSKEKEENNNL